MKKFNEQLTAGDLISGTFACDLLDEPEVHQFMRLNSKQIYTDVILSDGYNGIYVYSCYDTINGYVMTPIKHDVKIKLITQDNQELNTEADCIKFIKTNKRLYSIYENAICNYFMKLNKELKLN